MKDTDQSYLMPHERQFIRETADRFGLPASLKDAAAQARLRRVEGEQAAVYGHNLSPRLQKSLKGLPLEDLTVQRHPLTQELALVAPVGKIFEMRGSFEIYAQGFAPKDTEHNQNLAYITDDDQYQREYPDGWDDPAMKVQFWSSTSKRKFQGKNLVIVPNQDGSETIADAMYYGDGYKGPRLKVTGEVGAFPDYTLQVLTPSGFPGLYEQTHFITHTYDYAIRQSFGVSGEGNVSINLVDHIPDTGLYVSPIPTCDSLADEKTGLFLAPQKRARMDAVDTDPDVDDFKARMDRGTSYYYGRFREKHKGIPFTHSQRMYDMQWSRDTGLPFTDDLYTKELSRHYVPFSYEPGSLSDPIKMSESIRQAEIAFRQDRYMPLTEAEKHGRVSLYLPEYKPLIQRKVIVDRNGEIKTLDELWSF